MLGTIQQMLEKTHNAVNTLRDRLSVVELAIHQTRTEQERKEVFPSSGCLGDMYAMFRRNWRGKWREGSRKL